MKPIQTLCAILCLCLCEKTFSQEEDRSATFSLTTGVINYQGDMNQSVFTFKHANPFTGIIIRKPLNSWFALRAGFNVGTIGAADKWNSNYLKARNLSFTTSIKEAYGALEISIPGLVGGRVIPYFYAGIAVFHFNPWTRDDNGVKTFLKPLSTEGEGLSQFPEQKPYNLTQISLPYGAGIKFPISSGMTLGVEFSQRKSFTDYLDDLSTNYVDRDILLQEKGSKAVELAYRADELPGGRPLFPANGEQRGLPGQMDWYYSLGITLETKLSSVGDIFSLFKNHGVASQRCPKNFY